MVDSGSISTFIDKSVAERLNLYIIPKSKSVALADPSHKANIIGEVVVDVCLNNHIHSGIVVEVIDSLFIDMIVGKDILKKHRKVTFNFQGPKNELVIGALSEKDHFPEMKIQPPPLFTNLKSNIKPIATKSRRYTKPDSLFIKAETEKLLKEGVIEHSVSPWRAQVLVTSNDNHKKRMVVDYSDTVNLFTELDAYPMPNIATMVDQVAQYNVFTTLDLKSAYHQVPIKKEDRKYTGFEVGGKLYQFKRIPFGVTNGVSAFQRTIDKIIQDESLEDTFAYIDNVTICGRTQEEPDKNLAAFLEVCEKYNITLNNSKSIISATSITLLGYTIRNNQITPDYDRLRPLLEMPPPTNLKSQKRMVGMFSYYSKFIKNFSEKIHLLNRNVIFPIPSNVSESLDNLKNSLKNAMLVNIDPDLPFDVETDAGDFCIAATLNQKGRPVAFFSRTLNQSEMKYHAVEKEATSIIEAVRQWRHFLLGKKFKIITDQKSISYMYDNSRKSKIKNDKISRWRVELSQFSFDVVYRPGRENAAADTFSRIAAVTHPLEELRVLHRNLCHPGITRLLHFVRSRNLPFTQDQVKQVSGSCQSCLYLKPKFCTGQKGTLINAIHPFQRLSIDFKGPLPVSQNGNRYLLTVIDEFSRFPFAYPCKDMSSRTVTHCFNNLFSLFGMPDMIHNDRAPDFLSNEVTQYLHQKGITTSRTSRHNPQGNGQVEKLNGTLWKAIEVTLHSKNMKLSEWETVLPDALHSIRSLLCTATNMTPHERLFNFPRKSTAGKSIPS